MLDDRTHDRIDYVRISRKFDVTRGLEWSGVLVASVREWQAENPTAKGGVKAGTVKRFDDGEYLYSVQVWGEACGFLEHVDFERYYKYVSRLDFRMEADLTPSGIDSLEDLAKKHNSRKRNIQKIDSRAREKKEGRSPGGYGLAVGSHGSTRRLSCYKRGKERGAIELQLALAECTKVINRAVFRIGEERNMSNRDKWLTVMQYGIDELESAAQQTFQASFEDVLNVGNAGSADHNVQDYARYQVQTHLQVLDRDTKKEIMMALQMELF